jgi:hypothetical protein
MKKTIVFITLIVILLSTFLFTGCANQVLYGTWQLTETIDANTLRSESTTNSIFANIMVFKINRDKTVTFLDSEFGTFTKSRNEFTFTYMVEEGAEAKVETGAWELDGGTLRIWLDAEPVIYQFIRVEENAK